MNYAVHSRPLYRRAMARMAAAIVLLACASVAHAGQEARAARTQPGELFVCGQIASGRPLGRSAVLSAAQGTAYCFSDFLQVAGPEQVTHHWFFRDREVAHFRLTLQPPRWSTYSSLNITADSRGPWRVEVRDQDGALYGVVRFSIVD